MNILQSFLTKNSNLQEPIDKSSANETYLPFLKSSFIVEPSSRQSDISFQEFKFKGSDTNFLNLKMMYLKIQLPEQKIDSKSLTYCFGYERFGLLNFIEKIGIYAGQSILEQFSSIELLNRLQRIYLNNNWDLFTSKILNFDSNSFGITTPLCSPYYNMLLEEKIVYLPLPFSIIMNAEKFKTFLYKNEFKVRIDYRPISTMYCHNMPASPKFNEISPKESRLVLEGQILADNLNLENSIYFGSTIKNPYFIKDHYTRQYTTTKDPDTEQTIDLFSGHVSEIDIYTRIFKDENTYYGFDCESALRGYFNQFIHEPASLPSNKKYLLNLKTGLFFGNSNGVVDKISCIKIDSMKYQITLTEFTKTYSTVIHSNKMFELLSSDLYFDLSYFENFSYRYLSLFYFYAVTFSFLNNANNSFLIVDEMSPPNVITDGGRKILGGIFNLNGQNIMGFSSFLTNLNLVNEEFISATISLPVDPLMRRNDFANLDFFKMNKSLVNSWDLDSKYPIKINYRECEFSSDDLKTKEQLNEEQSFIFSDTFESSESETRKILIPNFTYIYDSMSTGASKRIANMTLKITLWSSMINRCMSNFELKKFLIENKLSITVESFFQSKRYLYLVDGELGMFEENPVISYAIFKNYLNKVMSNNSESNEAERSSIVKRKRGDV